MLLPPKTLLSGRGDQHPVAHERRRSVGVEGVEAEYDQLGDPLPRSRRSMISSAISVSAVTRCST